MDDLQLSTAHRRNLDTALHKCVTDLCAKGNDLQGMCVISTTRQLDFPCFDSTATIFNHRPVFFPRVRTPYGHGAQVIVEGREEQSDGGEKNKDNQIHPQPNKPAHRPSLHHLVVFPLCKVKQVKRKLMTINGPEFSNEKHSSAGLRSSKVSKKASNGLYFMITGEALCGGAGFC